jgi:glycosidase
VYYGDEAGQEGYKDPFNRRTYPWGYENLDLIHFTAELAKIRRSCRVFEKGDLHFIEVTRHHCVLSRADSELGEAVVVYLNRSRRTAKFKIKPAQLKIGKVVKFEIIKSSAANSAEKTIQRKAGSLQISPYDYAVVKFVIEK